MKKTLLTVFIVFVISINTVFGISDTTKTNPVISKAAIENLKCFTEIYGLVMNFYPAPKRDSINWNNYLSYSVDYILANSGKKSPFEIFKNLLTPIFTKVEVSQKKLEIGSYKEETYYFLRHIGYRQSLKDMEAESAILPINLKQKPQNEAAEKVIINFITLPEVIKNYQGFSVRIPRLLSIKDYDAELAMPDNTQLLNEIKNVKNSNKKDTRPQWIGSFIITWNTYKYFYPYKEDSQLNLDKELDSMMKKICSMKINDKTYLTMTELFIKVNDAHFRIFKGAPDLNAYLPVHVKKIGNKFKVSDLLDKSEFMTNDEILEIDKVPVIQEFNRSMNKISGSRHYRETMALALLGPASNKKNIPVKVMRGKNIVEFNVNTINSIFNWSFPKKEVEKQDGGIYYINMTRATFPSVQKEIGDCSKVKGLILDFRGYPKDAAGIMLHLIKDTIAWAFHSTPVIYDPSGKNNTWRFNSMKLPPQSPFFNCPKVFLAQATTQSQPETWLEIVKQFKIGKIVGSNTAGGNGGRSTLPLFGGYYLSFTSTRILNYDGTKIFLKGVEPDVAVKEEETITRNSDLLLNEAVKILMNEIGKKGK